MSSFPFYSFYKLPTRRITSSIPGTWPFPLYFLSLTAGQILIHLFSPPLLAASPSPDLTWPNSAPPVGDGAPGRECHQGWRRRTHLSCHRVPPAHRHLEEDTGRWVTKYNYRWVTSWYVQVSQFDCINTLSYWKTLALKKKYTNSSACVCFHSINI